MIKKNNFLIKVLKAKRRLNLGNIPIMYAFALVFGVIFILISSLSLVLLSSYKSDKEKSTLSVVNQMNNQTINKIDDYVNNIINLTKIPLFLNNLPIGDTRDGFVNELEVFSKTGENTLILQKFVEETAYMILNGSKYVNSVFVFNIEGKSEYKHFSKVFPPEFIDLNREKWFQKAIESRGSPVIISTYSLPNYMDSSNKPHYIFSVARGIMDLPMPKAQGAILINCDLGIFKELFKAMFIGVKDQRITIINTNGDIVYDTDESDIAKKFDSSLYDFVNDGSTGTKRIDLNDTKYLISYATSELTGWKIVNMVSENELFKPINETWNFVVILSSLLIIIALVLAILLSNRIISPLRKLNLLMELVKKGDFEVKIKSSSRNEVGQLTKTFNSMARRIKRLINEVYVDKIKQKDLELKMLQNQINPHFLYNALESIHMVAEINNDNEASEMSRSLGRILRYGISRKDGIVTVKQEIDHLNDYILLQKARFSRLYEIAVNVNEDIYENRIIKLILQPLVENAVYHGLDSVSKGGRVEVTGYSKDDCIIFEVTDNGAGMDEKQVEIINNYINDLDSTMNSIGLKNIQKRIQLYYGNEYGIEVKSTLAVGTCVIVTLPSIKY